MKVRITATGDTIVLKFLLPSAHTKLEGYILGYGSRMFSKQFIMLPENGLPFVKEFGKNVCSYPSSKIINRRCRRKMMSFSAEEGWQFVLFLYLDAEPKYLIAVKPFQINEVKKYCKGNTSLNKTYWWCSRKLWLLRGKKRWYFFSGKVELEKPLNLVVGPVTPSSVLLSWGDSLKNPYTGSILKECLEEGWVWPSTRVPAAAQAADHTDRCSHQTNNRLSANEHRSGLMAHKLTEGIPSNRSEFFVWENQSPSAKPDL